MAKFAHSISYKVDGTGPLRETIIHANSVNEAKEKFAEVFPTARIEKVLTTVPSKS